MSVKVQAAVRHLVEYVYRSGSIESGYRSTSSLTEGTKAHQNIQRQYAEHDAKEVYLSVEVLLGDGLTLVIDGRCDGLLRRDEGMMIEEIKSTARDLSHVEEHSYPVHWAQAKCYAYMYALEHQAVRMSVMLTYVHVETGEQKRFVQEAEFGELEAFVLQLAERYAPYARMFVRHKRERDASIANLEFPFAGYRAGQRKLAGAVYRTIEEGRKLYAQAPTGIGKTMSTAFPAVKAIGGGLLERFYYLTAKTIARTAAEEAFSRMQARGLRLHAVTLTAKEKICFQEHVSCTKEDCPYADGYYDRINDAVLDVLSHETLMPRPVVEQYARKHRVCPFEFSLDLAYAADAVICDYNYIFDPRVALKRQYGEQKRMTALLIDEAHNLVDRGRDMYSAAINKSEYLDMQRAYKAARPELYHAAKDVNNYLLAVRKRIGDHPSVEKSCPEELMQLLEVFVVQAEKHLATGAGAGDSAASQLLLDTYYTAQAFLRIGKLYDERYVTYMETNRSEVRVKLFCLDPSYLLQMMGKGYRSHTYFSATLSPGTYYLDMLGGGPDDYSLSVPSPFAKEQLDVRIEPLSTRYQDRERTREPLVQLLLKLTWGRLGNYLIFFPSYAYMNDVYEAFELARREAGLVHPVRTLLQTADMTEEERERFLMAFDADNETTLAGFAVMGGIFSEGIDLVGDRLTGVVVVGVGLPQLGLERDVIRDYFNGLGKNGFDYAYVYPGMNKVLQAGGRLIRSEDDRGMLVLVDDRYYQPKYRQLLPEAWR